MGGGGMRKGGKWEGYSYGSGFKRKEWGRGKTGPPSLRAKSKVRNSRNKPVVAKVNASSSTPGISPDVAKLKDMVKALLLDKKNQTQAPSLVKAVEESCVSCGGAHSYRICPAADGNVYRDNIQEFVSQAAAANFNQE
ncbi:hypothetical protein Tco_0400219 [Tanacetum coccineum]